jgi:hypothetical protein
MGRERDHGGHRNANVISACRNFSYRNPTNLVSPHELRRLCDGPECNIRSYRSGPTRFAVITRGRLQGELAARRKRHKRILRGPGADVADAEGDEWGARLLLEDLSETFEESFAFFEPVGIIVLTVLFDLRLCG